MVYQYQLDKQECLQAYKQKLLVDLRPYYIWGGIALAALIAVIIVIGFLSYGWLIFPLILAIAGVLTAFLKMILFVRDARKERNKRYADLLELNRYELEVLDDSYIVTKTENEQKMVIWKNQILKVIKTKSFIWVTDPHGDYLFPRMGEFEDLFVRAPLADRRLVGSKRNVKGNVIAVVTVLCVLGIIGAMFAVLLTKEPTKAMRYYHNPDNYREIECVILSVQDEDEVCYITADVTTPDHGLEGEGPYVFAALARYIPHDVLNVGDTIVLKVTTRLISGVDGYPFCYLAKGEFAYLDESEGMVRVYELWAKHYHGASGGNAKKNTL